MQRPLVTAIPRGAQRISRWRFSTTLASHQDTMPTQTGIPRTLKYSSEKSPNNLTFFRLPLPEIAPSFRRPFERRVLERRPSKKTGLAKRFADTTVLDTPDPLWLRDACSCELCVDPSSKQKRFQTSDIPLEIDYLVKEVGPDGTLSVAWSNDIDGFGRDHVSSYTADFLSRYNPPPAHSVPSRPRTFKLWNKAIIEKSVKFIEFGRYMSQDSVLYDVLNQLQEYGLVFLRNVPESEKSVEDIAGRIGPLQHTFYGLTWDVKSVPEATNVAYTHQYLGLHMDLLYTADPPALQLLHCLKNTCEGGTSLFSDSQQAATQFRKEDRIAFKQLLQQKTAFVYDNAGEYYQRERTVIRRHQLEDARLIVNWSPPFQGPFNIQGGILNSDGASAFRAYAAALKKFAAHIESPENVYEYRLKEGECVIFSNRRVLHARTAFDIKSGERWLKGAYVNNDAFTSRHTVLKRIFGGPTAPSSS